MQKFVEDTSDLGFHLHVTAGEQCEHLQLLKFGWQSGDLEESLSVPVLIKYLTGSKHKTVLKFADE